MDDPLLLSVVIPVRDEVENVDRLARDIEISLEGLAGGWECLWVDDGSTDGTAEHLVGLEARNPRHRVLRLPEGRGQTAALLVGFRAARGEFVSSLDGDGQNDPRDLVPLLDLCREKQLDLVNGVRRERHDSLVRRVSSRIANAFRNRLTHDTTTDVGCAIRVMRRRFVSAIPPYRGMHRFLPTFVRLAGGRIGEATVAHHPRTAGQSKYGINNRLWAGLADVFAVRWITQRYVRLDPSPPTLEAMPVGAAPAAPQRGGASAGPWLALASLALLLGFAFQGTRGLWEPDEGRYAECAREMLVTGDFLTPRLGSEPHFTKPPLTYWSIALPMALFGRSPWAVRLYLALAYAATVLVVAALGRRLWNRRTGLLAGLIYATSLLPFAGGGFVTPDTLLTLWEAIALYAGWRAWAAETPAERTWWPAVTGAAFGLAFLTKGPPGLLFLPALLLFRWLPAGRRPGAAPVLNAFGVVSFLVIGFSWYIVVILRNPGLLSYFLKDEVVGRVVGQHHRNNQWYGALVIYGPALVLGSLPWVFCWPLIWRRIREMNLLRSGSLWRAHPRALFLALSFGLPLLVFSLSRSRLVLYVLPLFVPLSLISARAIPAWPGRLPEFDGRALLSHAWTPRLAGWVVMLLAARLAIAHWPSDLDDRSYFQRLRLPAGSELVFVDTNPRFGLGFYSGTGIERVSWTEGSPDRASGDYVEQELAEVKKGDPHVFLVRSGEEVRLDRLFRSAGLHSTRIPLGPMVALVPDDRGAATTH